LEAEQGGGGDQRRGGGRHRDDEAARAGVGDEVVDIVTLEWIAAGEDEQRRLGEGGELVDQRAGLRFIQLVGVPLRLGAGAAVAAGQVASPRHFIEGDERAVIEVGGGVG